MITLTNTSQLMYRNLFIPILCCFVVLCACSSDSDNSAEPDAAGEVIDAAVSDTWDSFASAFFQVYCHECHGPGDSQRDYSLLETIRSEESKIRCGVSAVAIGGCTIPARQFPIGSGATPTDEERRRLVQWIEDGADRP